MGSEMRPLSSGRSGDSSMNGEWSFEEQEREQQAALTWAKRFELEAARITRARLADLALAASGVEAQRCQVRGAALHDHIKSLEAQGGWRRAITGVVNNRPIMRQSTKSMQRFTDLACPLVRWEEWQSLSQPR